MASSRLSPQMPSITPHTRAQGLGAHQPSEIQSTAFFPLPETWSRPREGKRLAPGSTAREGVELHPSPPITPEHQTGDQCPSRAPPPASSRLRRAAGPWARPPDAVDSWRPRTCAASWVDPRRLGSQGQLVLPPPRDLRQAPTAHSGTRGHPVHRAVLPEARAPAPTASESARPAGARMRRV